jgi:putative DNA primase/helicase
VQEAVTSHLDFPLLKTLSGGDSVSAAGMRENARQIRPTWKLFLVSNEQPVFPADAAFRSRVHLVPFRADFSRSPETTIDETLRRELPGILAELIRLAPSVIHEGLRPPASVLLATQDLFAELDVAARFQADWLTEDVDSMEEVTDVQAAAIAWLQRVAGEGVDWDVRRLMGELRKRFGKRYSVRRVNGESARVLLGVKLKADAPAKPSTSGLVAA